MKWILTVSLLIILIEKMHNQGCEVQGDGQTYTNIVLQSRKLLQISGDKEKIATLDFNNCELSTIYSGNFNGFKNVKYLWLDNNKVHTIEPEAFSGLNSLKILGLHSNSISEIEPGAISSLVDLEELYLYTNEIEHISGGIFNSNLRTLWIGSNKIRELPEDINSYTKLKVLFFGHNYISEIKPGALRSLTDLEDLSFASNNIEKLSTGIFNSTKNLRTLWLGGNKIRELPEDINSLTKLKILYLEHNKISEIKPGTISALVDLEELYLYNNEIENISGGIFNSNLRTLWIGSNKIRELPEDINSYTKLKVLFFGHNYISEIKPGALKSLTDLEDLSFASNNIEKLSTGIFNSMKNLRTLWLGGNKIRKLPEDISSLGNLRELHLYDNVISNFQEGFFQNMQQLTLLNIERNILINLDSGVFNGLKNLEFLDLSHNQLTVIPKDCLRRSVKLKEIHIDGNNIGIFDIGYFLFFHPDLTKIWLNKNAWECKYLEQAAEELRLRPSLKIMDNSATNTQNDNGIDCNIIKEEEHKYSENFEESRIYITYY